jgi:tRNA A-37 threonylcarbamoyl transferase component Bud32
MVRAMHSVAGSGRVVGGRYRLQDPIGRGAMGTVWRGRDELLDRDVAVKEVKVPPTLSPADRSALYQRTLREAKTAARLNHPGVVTVFDVVEEDGRPWIVMELVQARSLERVLADDGPLPVPDAAGIGRQLVSALATAHAAGVLHRDVKPSNVLLAPDGRAVLTDFGIATFEGDERLTQAGMVMGIPEFTPPERIRGEPATPSFRLVVTGCHALRRGAGPGAVRRPRRPHHHDERGAARGRARRALGWPARTCYLRADAQGSGGAARRRPGFDAAGGGAGEAAAPHGSRPGASSGCRSTRRPRRPVLLVCPAVLVAGPPVLMAGSPVLAGPARAVHLRRPGSRRAAKLRPHGHGSRAGRRG